MLQQNYIYTVFSFEKDWSSNS